MFQISKMRLQFVLFFWIILLRTPVTPIDSSQVVMQNLESKVIRGLGMRHIGKLAGGSAGYHRLCMYLNVTQLQELTYTIRKEIAYTTQLFQTQGIKWKSFVPEEEEFRLPATLWILQSVRPQSVTEINANLEEFVQIINERIVSKGKSLMSLLYLVEGTVENFKLLTSQQVPQQSSRKGRQTEGLFPIFSEISSVLFGTATAKDLKATNQIIQQISKKQQQVISFVDSFTSVVAELQEQFDAVQNATLDAITTSLQTFRTQMLNTTFDITKSLVISALRIQNIMEQSITEVSEHLNLLQLKINSYLLSLNQVLNGKFPLEIIGAQQLISYLFSIESRLPEGMMLAISDFKRGSVLETVKHTTCHIVSESDQLIIVCELELMKISEVYELYHVFPAPTAVNQASVFGKPLYYSVDTDDQTFMGVTSDGLSYVFLTQSEMDNCFHTSDRIICHNHFLEHKAASRSSCAFAIYTNDLATEEKVCRKNLVTLDSLFVYPLSDSLYYFATNQNHSLVTLKCPRSGSWEKDSSATYYHVNITYSAVLNISRFCAIYSEFFYISEEYVSSSTIDVNPEIPKLNLRHYITEMEHLIRDVNGGAKAIFDKIEEVVNENPHFQPIKGHVKIPLNELKRRVDDLKTNEMEVVPKLHPHSLEYLCLSLIVVVIGVIGFLLYKQRQIWYIVVPKSGTVDVENVGTENVSRNVVVETSS